MRASEVIAPWLAGITLSIQPDYMLTESSFPSCSFFTLYQLPPFVINAVAAGSDDDEALAQLDPQPERAYSVCSASAPVVVYLNFY